MWTLHGLVNFLIVFVWPGFHLTIPVVEALVGTKSGWLCLFHAHLINTYFVANVLDGEETVKNSLDENRLRFKVDKWVPPS